MRKVIESIKYIFTDKDWQNKLLLILAVYIGITFIGSMFSFVFQVPLEILSTVFENNKELNQLFSMFSSFASLGSSLFTFPLVLFMYGYLVEYIENIQSENKVILPEVRPILEKVKVGVRIFVTLFIVQFPSMFLITLSFFGMVIPYALVSDSVISLPFAIIISILSFIFIIFISLLNFAIQVASGYIFVSTKSARKAINFKTIVSVVTTNEKPILNILKYFILLAILQMVAGLSSILFICVIFAIAPIITLAGYFAKAYILADQFKQFKPIK